VIPPHPDRQAFRVECRRTWFKTIDEMQVPVDDYLVTYNTKRPHQGRGMNGRTPVAAAIEGMPKPSPEKKEKLLSAKPSKQLVA